MTDALSRNPINIIDVKQDNNNVTIKLVVIKNQQDNNEFCSQITQVITNTQNNQVSNNI